MPTVATGNTSADYVNTGLGTEKSDRVEENVVFDIPVGIASEATDEYQIVAKQFDIDLIGATNGTINTINANKEAAVAAGIQALGPYKAGVLPPLCPMYPGPPPDNTISSGQFELEAQTGIGTLGVDTPEIGFSQIRKDSIRIQRYPNLEARVAPNDNPLENMKFPILTTANAGQGAQNILALNSIWYDAEGDVSYYILDDEGNYTDNLEPFTADQTGGDFIGNYYPIDPDGTPTSSYDISGTLNSGNVFTPDAIYGSSISDFFTGIQPGCTWSYMAPNDPEDPTPGEETYTQIGVSWNATSNLLTPDISGDLFDVVGFGTLTAPTTDICNQLRQQQISLIASIDSSRSNLDPNFIAANTCKARKTSAQLELWSAQYVKRLNLQESFGIDNNPRDITVTIPAVDLVAPQLPTNTNTADAFRGDLRADNNQLTVDSK